MIHTILDSNPLPLLDFGNPDIFVAHLQLNHGLMLASEPLLEEALKQDLPAKLKDYYAKHLEEERGHAQWLEKDINTFGVKVKSSWSAAQIAGTQYYLIKHISPIALLGYMAAFECRQQSLNDIALLESKYGVDALKCTRYHAENDPQHSEELLTMIQMFDEPIIYKNCDWTAKMLNQAILFDIKGLTDV